MEFKKYKIKNIGKVVGGATPVTTDPQNYDGDISWITPNDLSKHKDIYIYNGERNITPKGLKEIGNTLLPAGTVLFSSRAPVGYVAIAGKQMCTNQGFKSVIPNALLVYPEFLYYTLGYYKSYIEKHGSGTTFVEVSAATMENIELPFPSLDNQVKIADTLLKIDRKISLNTRINAELEAMAKQLYDYWFVQFDFPDENGKPYKSSGGKMVYNEKLKREIPEGWEVKGLRDVLTFSNGINYEKGIEGDKEYKIINVRNITNSSIFINKSELDNILLPSKQADNYLIEENNIIIARSGTPGSTRLIDNPNNVIYCGFIIKGSLIDSIYKYYVLFFLKQLEGTQATKTGGSILQNVSQETLKTLNLVLPSEHLTKVFNEKIMALFSLLNKKQDEKNELTHLRDFLLPMLMNGQVTIE